MWCRIEYNAPKSHDIIITVDIFDTLALDFGFTLYFEQIPHHFSLWLQEAYFSKPIHPLNALPI